VQYEQMRVACHAADGSANIVLGAPKLSDNIWLYGGDAKSIQTVVMDDLATINFSCWLLF